MRIEQVRGYKREAKGIAYVAYLMCESNIDEVFVDDSWADYRLVIENDETGEEVFNYIFDTEEAANDFATKLCGFEQTLPKRY